jgi:ABC-type glycerol-3-phosphate transport system permease component
MLRYFLNTAIVSVCTTALSMLVATLGAYGFSRYRFPGSNGVLGFIMFTRVLPRVTIIIPFYVTLRQLRLINTYPGLILVYLMVVMPVTIWMLKGFFDSIPYEIEEAASIDGCSPVKMLFQIVLPICLPALAAVGMYAFILSWNEFLFALIMTNDKATRPISVGLAFYIDEAGIHWGELMAASALMSVPAMVVFSLSQNMLVKGLTAGAVKG